MRSQGGENDSEEDFWDWKGAVEKASGELAGFRAAGVIPNLKGGQPVATVLLSKGNQYHLVNVMLG